jgi:hypothetical protein
LHRLDGDVLASVALGKEPDASGDAGIEGEIASLTDVLAGMEAIADLADNDRAAGDDLSVVGLDAAALRIAVAPIT